MPKNKISTNILISFVLFTSLIFGFSQPILAAALTGDIAVIDIQLATPLSTVDNFSDKIAGTIKIFQKHGTPLTSKGALNLARIRVSPVALVQKIELKRRGSSSLSYPKKNYSLDLKGQASSILGMPAEKEWVMHSCWADKTCLRNLIGYWQAAKLLPGSPRTEFAEVFINNEYRGLYLITEKITIGSSRVNLPSIDTGNITGTYLLKRDGDDTNWDWTSNTYADLHWWFVEPKKKNITSAQLNHISNFMSTAVEPLFNPDSKQYKPSNYASVIDTSAAAKFIILQEIANNVDGYWKSMYVTKRRDNRLYMGPIWDLDVSFANANIAPETCQTDNWRIEQSRVLEPLRFFQPLSEMWKVPKFRKILKSHWYYFRSKAIISPSAINSKLTATSNRIKAARARDDKKWQTIGQTTWWECSVQSTHLDEVAELKRWINTRIDWMDKTLLSF